MTEQDKPDLSKVEPLGTWSDEEAPGSAPSAGADRDAVVDPIPGSPAAALLVDEPADAEPKASPETEQELDQLRRG